MNAAATFDGTLAAVTADQVLNATSAARVYMVPDCLGNLRNMARWIPTGDDFEMDLLRPILAANTTETLKQAFIVLCFEGLRASAQVGQIYVSTAMSFKPPAALNGLYDCKIRGAYEGTHRVLHQLRKRGVQVNFD